MNIFTEQNPFPYGQLDAIFIHITDIYVQMMTLGVDKVNMTRSCANISSEVLSFVAYASQLLVEGFGGPDYEYLIEFKYQQTLQKIQPDDLNALLLSKFLLAYIRNNDMDQYCRLTYRHCGSEIALSLVTQISQLKF